MVLKARRARAKYLRRMSSSPCSPTTLRCARCGSIPGWPAAAQRRGAPQHGDGQHAHRARAGRGSRRTPTCRRRCSAARRWRRRVNWTSLPRGRKRAAKMRAAVSGIGETDLRRGRGTCEGQCGEDRAQFPARHRDREPRRGLRPGAQVRRGAGRFPRHPGQHFAWIACVQELRKDDRRAGVDAGAVRHAARSEGRRAGAGHGARGRHGSPVRTIIRKHLLEAIAEGRAEQDWAALAGKLAADAGL